MKTLVVNSPANAIVYVERKKKHTATTSPIHQASNVDYSSMHHAIAEIAHPLHFEALKQFYGMG